MSTPQTRPSTPVSAAAGNVDVLPAGGGISGIGAGYRLKTSWSPARRAPMEGTAGD
jgi:hypothetical protein